jgi:hypothetical protein
MSAPIRARASTRACGFPVASCGRVQPFRGQLSGRKGGRSEPDPVPWEAASVTERWFNVIYGYEECRWKRFYPDDPRKPTEPVLPQRHGVGQVVPFKRQPT